MIRERRVTAGGLCEELSILNHDHIPVDLTVRVEVQYPTACSPQAWSAGAPLLFLRTMLGLETSGENLVVNPALPKAIGRIELLDIPGRWRHMDAYGRGTIDVDSP